MRNNNRKNRETKRENPRQE